MKQNFFSQLLSSSGVCFLSVCLILSGCATISGRQRGNDRVSFDSNSERVEVECSNMRIFTPGYLQLKRSESHECTAKLKGYESQKFTITSKTDGRGFGASTGANFMFALFTIGSGFILGWLIDWPSGAMKNLRPNKFYFEMKPAMNTKSA